MISIGICDGRWSFYSKCNDGDDRRRHQNKNVAVVTTKPSPSMTPPLGTTALSTQKVTLLAHSICPSLIQGCFHGLASNHFSFYPIAQLMVMP